MRTLLGVLALAGLLAGVTAFAEEPASGSPAGGLDLSVRARALGVVPEPAGTATLDLETMKAPTGAGVTRMPLAASGGKPGVYVGVVVCEPDGTERFYQVRIDDAGSLPERDLRGTPGPRTLFVPGRP